jgi:hypothetical protein
MNPPSPAAQAAAVEALIAILFAGRKKPKGSEADLLQAQALAAVETLRGMAR